MQILNRLNVGSRLGLGFALILLLMGIMMFVSLNQMQRLQAELDKTAGEFRERLLLINRMRDSVRFQAIALRDVVSQEDIAFKKSELKLMREARKNYREASEQLEQHPEVAPQLQNLRPLECDDPVLLSGNTCCSSRTRSI
jgi:CHASE3 domain sensor protein